MNDFALIPSTAWNDPAIERALGVEGKATLCFPCESHMRAARRICDELSPSELRSFVAACVVAGWVWVRGEETLCPT